MFENLDLSAFLTFVRLVLYWFSLFPLPLHVWDGLRLALHVWDGLRFVIVALLGLFSYLF